MTIILCVAVLKLLWCLQECAYILREGCREIDRDSSIQLASAELGPVFGPVCAEGGVRCRYHEPDATLPAGISCVQFRSLVSCLT